jgi:arabinogalactan endo-1,4-beta-galactosidase
MSAFVRLSLLATVSTTLTVGACNSLDTRVEQAVGGAGGGAGASMATTVTGGGGIASGNVANGGASPSEGRPASRGAAGDTGGATSPPEAGGAPGSGGVTNAGGTTASAGGGHLDAGATDHRDASNMTRASYLIGADITFVQADEAAGVTYSDSTVKDIFQLLKDHGFNAIRLRTFVDPRAKDGYDKQQGYGDLGHTITFGRRIKNAGMTFLLDFHYSDNWADPGKQCIPVAWQGLSLADTARALHDYTKDAIAQLIAGGARLDLVQIGNEITPGMLLHICDANGQPMMQSAVNGSVANWANLGMLLNAGIAAVREVDANIKIVLHIDRCGDKPSDRAGAALATSIDWITKATAQGVAFDVFAESCYQAFQGDPSSADRTRQGWTNTLSSLASRFPSIEFLAAEYGSLEREINDVVYGLSAQRGLGTFYWEPTHETQGNSGHALFATSGNPRQSTQDLLLYDAMQTAYAPRL